jgi:hypothetical protein
MSTSLRSLLPVLLLAGCTGSAPGSQAPPSTDGKGDNWTGIGLSAGSQCGSERWGAFDSLCGEGLVCLPKNHYREVIGTCEPRSGIGGICDIDDHCQTMSVAVPVLDDVEARLVCSEAGTCQPRFMVIVRNQTNGNRRITKRTAASGWSLQVYEHDELTTLPPGSAVALLSDQIDDGISLLATGVDGDEEALNLRGGCVLGGGGDCENHPVPQIGPPLEWRLY